MKNESRAKWGDLKIENTEEIILGNVLQYWQSSICQAGTPSIEVEVNGDSGEQSEIRAKQICAVPAMVALLKRLSELDSYSECVAEAKHILAQIGEIE